MALPRILCTKCQNPVEIPIKCKHCNDAYHPTCIAFPCDPECPKCQTCSFCKKGCLNRKILNFKKISSFPYEEYLKLPMHTFKKLIHYKKPHTLTNNLEDIQKILHHPSLIYKNVYTPNFTDSNFDYKADENVFKDGVESRVIKNKGKFYESVTFYTKNETVTKFLNKLYYLNKCYVCKKNFHSAKKDMLCKNHRYCSNCEVSSSELYVSYIKNVQNRHSDGKKCYVCPYTIYFHCSKCYKAFKNNEYCPVCFKIYKNDDYNTKMMCCDLCERWIHLECDERMSLEEYNELSNNESLMYICKEDSILPNKEEKNIKIQKSFNCCMCADTLPYSESTKFIEIENTHPPLFAHLCCVFTISERILKNGFLILKLNDLKTKNCEKCKKPGASVRCLLCTENLYHYKCAPFSNHSFFLCKDHSQPENEIIFNVKAELKVAEKLEEKIVQVDVKKDIPKICSCAWPPADLSFNHTLTHTLSYISHKNLILSESKIQGYGLVAAKPFYPNEPIIKYEGEIITLEESNLREKKYNRKGVYLFRLDENRVIDATVVGGLAKYINHSCDPNCYSSRVACGSWRGVLICAKRFINVGEELNYDYFFSKGVDKVKCLCGSENCRKFLD